MEGAWVPALVRELDPTCGVAKKKKKKERKKERKAKKLGAEALK